jgi:nicotinamidase-related amidase
MTQQMTIDKGRAAVLIMDFQVRIVNNFASDPAGVVQKADQVLQGARQAGIPVIYVVHRGGPFREDSPDVEIHPGVAPAAGDQVITKTRTSPFSTTGLDVMLREMGRDSLVIMGVATSGCVLSTVRWAADINYSLTVVSDACSDPDAEVHRVLTEKIYPRQGAVITADEFLRAVGSG